MMRMLDKQQVGEAVIMLGDARSFADATATIAALARSAPMAAAPPQLFFKTRFGAPPPLLAGRGDALRVVDELLDDVENGHGDAALWGLNAPRGRGKTVLQDILVERAKARGIPVVRLDPGDSGEAMGVSLAGGLATESVTAGESGGMKTGAGIKLLVADADVEGQFGTHKARTETFAPPTPASALQMRLEADGRLLIVIDEAHLLNPDGAGPLARAYQTFGKPGTRLGLAFAGTPDLPDHLRRLRISFIGRPGARGQMTLGPISEADAMLAVFGPLAQYGILPEGMADVQPGAIATEVAQSCSGFPYFTQLWGEALHAAWRASPMQKHIVDQHMAEARKAFEAERKKLHNGLLEELKEVGAVQCARQVSAVLTERGAISVDDLEARVNQGLAERDELERSGRLRRRKTWRDEDGGPNGVITALLHLGFIWGENGAASDLFTAGIPCLAGHILE